MGNIGESRRNLGKLLLAGAASLLVPGYMKLDESSEMPEATQLATSPASTATDIPGAAEAPEATRVFPDASPMPKEVKEPLNICSCVGNDNAYDCDKEASIKEVFSSSSKEELDALYIYPDNVVFINKEGERIAPEDEKMNVLIVPVGFSKDKMPKAVKMMEEGTDLANKAFAGLPVNFGFLKQSVPIGINQRLHRGILNDPEEHRKLTNLLKSIDPKIDRILYFVNSDEYFGSAWVRYKNGKKDHAIISNPIEHNFIRALTNKDFFFLLIHELGHLVGELFDGYDSFYGNNFGGNTELWIDGIQLQSRVLEALEILAERNGVDVKNPDDFEEFDLTQKDLFKKVVSLVDSWYT